MQQIRITPTPIIPAPENMVSGRWRRLARCCVPWMGLLLLAALASGQVLTTEEIDEAVLTACRSDHEERLRQTKELLELDGLTGSQRSAALRCRAWSVFFEESPEAAWSLFDEAERLAREADDKKGLARVLSVRGVAESSAGPLMGRAIQSFLVAIEQASLAKDAESTAYAAEALAELLVDLDSPESALAFADRARAVLPDAEKSPIWPRLLLRAKILSSMGEFREAERILEDLRSKHATGDAPKHHGILVELGRHYNRKGEFLKALEILDETESLLPESRFRLAELSVPRVFSGWDRLRMLLKP